MKTLDPDDPAYFGYYTNNDNSSDYLKAHGFNYHNGPEWVWLYGYYLMAQYAHHSESKYARKISYRQFFDVYQHYKSISESEWYSLPELTNDNGSYCAASCGSQLWSIGTMLEAMNTLKRFT